MFFFFSTGFRFGSARICFFSFHFKIDGILRCNFIFFDIVLNTCFYASSYRCFATRCLSAFVFTFVIFFLFFCVLYLRQMLLIFSVISFSFSFSFFFIYFAIAYSFLFFFFLFCAHKHQWDKLLFHQLKTMLNSFLAYDVLFIFSFEFIRASYSFGCLDLWVCVCVFFLQRTSRFVCIALEHKHSIFKVITNIIKCVIRMMMQMNWRWKWRERVCKMKWKWGYENTLKHSNI